MERTELGEGAYLELDVTWLGADEAAATFAQLQREVPWEARAIRVFGREVMQPRLVSWHGEPDASYTYSGVLHHPLPWTPTLSTLRARLCRALSLPFNSVLCNLYRDGQDSMGMHSDAEPELGRDPVVASLSLGATRKFVLRRRSARAEPESGADVARGKLDLLLPSGSLLLMRGTTQHRYRHGVPKTQKPCGPRINLTFRTVHPR